MSNKKQCLVVVLSTFFVLLFQSSCSRQIAEADGFVNCQNGTSPTPIKQDFQFSGDLLFMKSDRSEILAFNGETHEFTSIYRTPIDSSYDISPLSPDGKTLVISFQKPSEMGALSITILSNRGAVENKKIPLPVWEQNQDRTNSWFSVDWANNNYLQGVLYDKERIEDELWEPWLLNPYQLEWKSLSSINNFIGQVERSGFSIAPDLTKVLYINKQYQLILYDLIRNKILWEYSDYDGVSPNLTSPNLSDAVWSTEGNLLALPITRNEARTPGILIIDRNGSIVNSIYFGDYQFGLSWSGDGQLLAFYEDRSVTNGARIESVQPVVRIMDMKDGLLRDLCLLNEQTTPSQGISNNRIIWSPDQQYLAYSSWNSDKTVQDGIILQKLSEPQVQIIPLDTDTMTLLGWSKEHWEKARP